MPEASQERGIWAERYVRDFLALPFISEFVFRSLQTLDGGTQKEVADSLLSDLRFAIHVRHSPQCGRRSRRVGDTVASPGGRRPRRAGRVDLAICTKDAGARRVLRTMPRCCRKPSNVPRPSDGIPSYIVLLVSSPLAVPFPAKCAIIGCLKIGVQSHGGDIGQMERQSVGKSFIIFTYFMSGRSAAW